MVIHPEADVFTALQVPDISRWHSIVASL